MDLTILVGAKKHVISVGEENSVNALMETVEEKTQIKQLNQKLIFKGVTLTKEPDKLLTDFGIKNGSKIMVIGKKYDSEEEAALNIFRNIEIDIAKLSKVTDDNQKQAQSILNGFLQKQYREEAFEKIRKELQKISLTLMKYLEVIDSMTLSPDFTNAKSKRKSVVVKLQALMDQCESLNESIDCKPPST